MKNKNKDNKINYRTAKKAILTKQQELELDFQKKITGLKDTNDVNINQFLSDKKTYVKPTFKQKLASKFKGILYIQARIRYPDGIDTIRFYPMVKPYVLDIGGKYYMFSPKSFRYENENMFLEFHYNNPFAVVYTPNKDKKKAGFDPSFDASAFKNIMQSKIIEDMMYQEDPNAMNFIQWIAIGASGLTLIMTMILMGQINNIKKLVTALLGGG